MVVVVPVIMMVMSASAVMVVVVPVIMMVMSASAVMMVVMWLHTPFKHHVDTGILQCMKNCMSEAILIHIQDCRHE